MDGPLEDVAFLARSESRVRILRALDERSRDRRELATVSGASRSTLSRTLADLEVRGWIEREGRAYETTTAGSILVETFDPLLQTVAGLRTLDDRLDLLPLEAIDLDVQYLHDARLITPTELDPTAHWEHALDRLEDAARMRVVARTGPPRYVEAMRDGAASGRLTVECVLDGAYLDAIPADHEMNRQWRELADGEGAVRRHEESIPYVVIILDETVQLWLCDDVGESQALLESENPAVRSWAVSTFEAHFDRATPLESSPSK